tara:strand:- start:30044 stop:30193 length:150 start_codon:yes stop_codon:yes gene_type:complete
VVILGRRHASDYETEPDFVTCVGDYIAPTQGTACDGIGQQLLAFLSSKY